MMEERPIERSFYVRRSSAIDHLTESETSTNYSVRLSDMQRHMAALGFSDEMPPFQGSRPAKSAAFSCCGDQHEYKHADMMLTYFEVVDVSLIHSSQDDRHFRILQQTAVVLLEIKNKPQYCSSINSTRYKQQDSKHLASTAVCKRKTHSSRKCYSVAPCTVY